MSTSILQLELKLNSPREIKRVVNIKWAAVKEGDREKRVVLHQEESPEVIY